MIRKAHLHRCLRNMEQLAIEVAEDVRRMENASDGGIVAVRHADALMLSAWFRRQVGRQPYEVDDG